MNCAIEPLDNSPGGGQVVTPDSPLKLCYFLRRYPRLSETFVVNEIQELRRLGIEVVIFARLPSDETVVQDKHKALDVPVYYLPSAPSIPDDAWSVNHFPKLIESPQRLTRDALHGSLSRVEHETLVEAAMIAPFVKGLGIDAIHAHFASWAATAASFVSSMTGIPYSFTAHAKDIYHSGIDRRALADKIAKARFVVTVSDFNQAYLKDALSQEGKAGRVLRLYNGMDLDEVRPKAVEKELNLIVGVGRLRSKKGFPDLVEACRILDQRGVDFRCVIIGKGKQMAALQALISRHGLSRKVALAGAMPHRDVMRTVESARTVVAPCVVDEDGDRDGLPTVIPEAMALGVPVVSTPVTGIPEVIIDDQTGLLVNERDPEALAQAIERLLTSDTLCKRLSAAALSKVKSEFDLRENVGQLRTYFLTGGQAN